MKAPPYNYNLYVISKLPIVLVGGKLLITYLSTPCSVSTGSFILFSHVENCPETLNVVFFPSYFVSQLMHKEVEMMTTNCQSRFLRKKKEIYLAIPTNNSNICCKYNDL